MPRFFRRLSEGHRGQQHRARQQFSVPGSSLGRRAERDVVDSATSLPTAFPYAGKDIDPGAGATTGHPKP